MARKPKAAPMRLRPHHLLDIVTDYKPDVDPDYVPAPGENGVRTVARLIGRTLDVQASFVIGADAICAPCSHLQANGRCDRILQHHTPPEPMDDYNDPLDARILGYLGLEPGATMPVRRFLEVVSAHLPGIETAYPVGAEQQAARREGMEAGLAALGVRVGS